MVLQTVCILLLFLVRWTAPFSVDSGHFNKKTPKRCSYFKEHGMMAVDCYGLDLVAVPQNLRTDTELLHATHNRIRELHRDSFKRYRYLKYLYLDDNMILYIENGTFDPLQDLEAIRLSYNGLDRVPPEILQLPKIRKIFLDNNRLIPGGGFVGAPASDTLESLTLAHCHLQQLPRLEGYPNLVELNVSGNNLNRILPQQLALMCQLKFLDLSGNPKLSEGSSSDGCDCHLLASWIAQRNIILQNSYKLKCSSNHDDFTHCGNTSEAMEIHEACMSAIALKAEAVQARRIWLIVIISVATICIVSLILFLFYQRNRRKKQKKKVSNNNNTDQEGVLPPEEQEISSDEMLNETNS
ncbi:hypothetical protein B7P43_G16628 [Cryptotermes secundus]|uniref:Uncharacterized protein n=2 Tax=Cryptotermes secundus TaxID=105785 RepID=A0A2J7Q828_9NEOP|nr:leucine-rich repeat-containing protein 38 isoform X2 [Cryptotermes secundus]XP_023716292.1 leucine-rich repeat-containing protein 38 isoform X2 [Cryptotermes secundus]PNF24733.1 hypothetical protein B7P43_G16628 [Cryptotermes secundus]PNF24734.1 hypothetical protein B7P43_G16628 [Cryptotermes secundus]PNF24735.1 hypothetical protein B7P43_G16628 [Cryptotermes secundus]PNF24736.1 hypothetical protein B7P43_G16628 [Cryptotermes secundus]PNF24737.1 hypothetical protein B7P43_G16628 [Cryptoter